MPASISESSQRNPNTDAKLACQLVTSLTRVELLGVAHDQTLGPEVREAARLLVQAKPPFGIGKAEPGKRADRSRDPNRDGPTR